MGCTPDACADCTRRCLLVHRKGETSTPLVSSFFKVMIGARFSEVLFIPPKFAPTVSNLIDQEIFVEDSSGQRWKVKFSNVEGSLALREGWNEFATNKKLEVGDFVIFNYIVGSHFVVQVYDKTGCEKLDFSASRSQKEVAKTININSAAKDGLRLVNEGSVKEHRSSSFAFPRSNSEITQGCRGVKGMKKIKITENTSTNVNVTGAKSSEEQFCMINRDIASKRENFESDIFDFPVLGRLMHKSFNGECKGSIAAGTKRSRCSDAYPSLSQKEYGFDNKSSLAKESGSEMWADQNDLKEGRKWIAASCKTMITGHLLIASTQKRVQDLKNSSEMPGEVLKRCQSVEGTESKPKVLQMEPALGSNFPGGYHDKVFGVSGLENIDKVSRPSKSSANIRWATTATKQPFLELPTPLLPCFKDKRKRQRKIVFLRDPCMRLWSVIYDETRALPTLMSGWEALRKANNIQPGDECGFDLENEEEDVYRVCIVRNRDEQDPANLLY